MDDRSSIQSAPTAPPAVAGDTSERAVRVLLWSIAGAGLKYGGPGMTAYRMYALADRSRLTVRLAHARADQGDEAPFASQHRVGSISGGMRSQMRFIRSARRWLDAHADEFDVFHGLQGFEITVRPAAYAERLGKPAVVKLAQHRHDLTDKGGLKTLLGVERRRRRLIATLSGVIAISGAIADELREIGVPESKIARIPNGVDTDQFRPAADAAERSAARAAAGWPDRPTIVFTGAVIPRKRPHLLVPGLAEAVRRGVDAQLALVGPETDAAYSAQIRDRAEQLGVSDRVLWTGFVPTVAPLLRGADVFALPSANEGMPNALLEAMASGLPAVVTRISGTTDLVDDGVHGRLVEPEEPSVSAALADLLADESSRHDAGRAARQRVEDGYSARAVLAAHERLFRRIMAGGPAAE
jgi:glycosyltransferase involved in cell wall biosynthesis